MNNRYNQLFKFETFHNICDLHIQHMPCLIKIKLMMQNAWEKYINVWF